MPWKRSLGAFLLFLALIMVFLMTAKMPAADTRRFPLIDPVEVPYGPNNFYNITIEPLNKTDYHVDVWISPYGDQAMMIDFWAVNKTGFDLLEESLAYSELRPEYPDERPFNSITTHAKEINITGSKRIELADLSHNGTYCLVAINFFQDTQSISVAVDERYAVAPRPILEPNLPSIIFTTAMVILGGWLVIAGRKRPLRRAKNISAGSQLRNTRALGDHSTAGRHTTTQNRQSSRPIPQQSERALQTWTLLASKRLFSGFLRD